MKAKTKLKNEIKKGHYEHKPKREFKASLSKDGKFWIFKDITTHIVPKEYLNKVQSSPDRDSTCNGIGGDPKVGG